MGAPSLIRAPHGRYRPKIESLCNLSEFHRQIGPRCSGAHRYLRHRKRLHRIEEIQVYTGSSTI